MRPNQFRGRLDPGLSAYLGVALSPSPSDPTKTSGPGASHPHASQAGGKGESKLQRCVLKSVMSTRALFYMWGVHEDAKQAQSSY